jgi:hypothetical protein
MRNIVLFAVASALTASVTGCPNTSMPDLEVCSLTLGDPAAGPKDTIEVPVTVTVCNTAVDLSKTFSKIDFPPDVVTPVDTRTTAGVFRIGLLYMTGGLGPFFLKFTVPGEASEDYAMTHAPLAAGASVTVSGKAVFPATMAGQHANITAEADQRLDGDPAHGLVEESNEFNNRAGYQWIDFR